jgi:hypothetical protein
MLVMNKYSMIESGTMNRTLTKASFCDTFNLWNHLNIDCTRQVNSTPWQEQNLSPQALIGFSEQSELTLTFPSKIRAGGRLFTVKAARSDGAEVSKCEIPYKLL